ncbi:MAG: DUF4331 family protein [Candidatus Acidiferrales bacterium]
MWNSSSIAAGLVRLWAGTRTILPLALLSFAGLGLLVASDHGDAPIGADGPRQDANITDFFAFTSGSNLVLILCANPAIPPGATSYLFPTDVTFTVHIDNDSRVEAGKVVRPERIDDDISFRFNFNDDGSVDIRRHSRRHGQHHGRRGRGPDDLGIVSLFTGLRDDPFIRGPRIGRNVAAMVLEVPLSSVLDDQSTLVMWVTSSVEDFDGRIQEMAGRSLVSMFPENALMNTMEPRLMFRRLGKDPDVMIYDTSLPAAFPNGRALSDDVVDLVGDNRVLANDAPFPSANDKPFLSTFPYLAPPH